MIKWKIGIYLRLSSDDGDKLESNSITNQRNMINLFLKKEENYKVINYYIDDGYSGTDFERPGFIEMLNDIKKGKLNTIIVKDLSRIGRNYIEVGNYIENVFPLYNIRFIAINDNIDSFKDPESINSLIVPFKNLINDEYARDISNKIRSVLDTKKINGEFIGSFAPYGYRKNPNNKHKLIIDKVSSKVVKKIFKMILEGHSRQEIIDSLNKCGIIPPRMYQMQDTNYKFKITDDMKSWNKKKIDVILNNRCYTGDLIQNKKKVISHKIHKAKDVDSDDWIVIPNHHEAIISKEEFLQVQDIIYRRDIRINKKERYDIFSGHLKCYDCQNNLTIRKGKKSEYYYCGKYLLKKCSKHSISKKELESIILKTINFQIDLVMDMDKTIENIINEENVNYDLEILKSRITEIEKGIEKYTKLKETIKDDLLCKYINQEDYIIYEKEYNDIINKYSNEKKETNKKIENIGLKSDNNKSWINKIKRYNNLSVLSKTAVDELIDNIYLYKDGNIKIIYKYEDKYIEAINFIKKHECDIMNKEFILN